MKHTFTVYNLSPLESRLRFVLGVNFLPCWDGKIVRKSREWIFSATLDRTFKIIALNPSMASACDGFRTLPLLLHGSHCLGFNAFVAHCSKLFPSRIHRMHVMSLSLDWLWNGIYCSSSLFHSRIIKSYFIVETGLFFML